MKKLLPLALAALALTSCDKEQEDLSPEPQNAAVIVHKQIGASFGYATPLQIDVNNDGKYDFSFGNTLVSDSEGAHNLFYIRALDQHQLLLNTTTEISAGNWGAGLYVNDLVEEDQAKNFQWKRDAGYLLDINKPDDRFTNYSGPMSFNGGSQYVGIRIKDGDAFKSGWIKLSYTMGSESIAVVEAAYLASENQSLKAGQR